MNRLNNILMMTALVAMLSSCLQFRVAEKKQERQFHNLGIEVELGSLMGLDREIHYTLSGRDSSKPMAVFVHGSPGSSSNFLSFAKDSSLLEKYQVLLIDRPGFGYSGFGNSEPSLQRQALIINDFLKNFHANKIVLIGHSLGGPIICRMAMDTSAVYHGLLIVAGSIDPDLEPKEPWRKPLNYKIFRWILPRSFRVSNQEILPAKKELQEMEGLWPLIEIPSCVIQGGKDKLVPPANADYAEEMLINVEKLKIVRLPEANHFIPFSQPELMVAELLEFF